MIKFFWHKTFGNCLLCYFHFNSNLGASWDSLTKPTNLWWLGSKIIDCIKFCLFIGIALFFFIHYTSLPVIYCPIWFTLIYIIYKMMKRRFPPAWWRPWTAAACCDPSYKYLGLSRTELEGSDVTYPCSLDTSTHQFQQPYQPYK